MAPERFAGTAGTAEPTGRSRVAAALLVVLLQVSMLLWSAPAAAGGAPDCAALPCSEALPAAVAFEPAAGGAPYSVGRDEAGEVVGWVARSTDVVDIKGYSGKPLVTLVGLSPDGVIAGAKVIHHSEPILLVGIPEKALHDFVSSYAGKSAAKNIVVGASSDPEVVSVDLVSGATTTILAQNKTILDTARSVGAAVGVLERATVVPGHFVSVPEVWSWKRMADEGVFGHIRVTQADMGVEGDDLFMDLYFAVADAPQVGRALLGNREYEWHIGRLKPGEHLLVVVGNGTTSFKGSGFVRGGIFERVRLEQGLTVTLFKDHDYRPLSRVAAADAPEFREGAVFVTRKGRLDPGMPFDFVFLGSRYDRKGGFSRDFHAFRVTHRVPRSVYVLDGPDPSEAIWRAAWHAKRHRVVILILILLATAAVFAGRRWTTADRKRLGWLHSGIMLTAVVVLGQWLKAQPSVTQVLTFVGSVVGKWRWDLFLTEPFIFVFWIFIAVVTVIWGRGVFCGWVCPYGALTELLFKLTRTVTSFKIELPDGAHRRLRGLRFLVLGVLVVVYLESAELGEKLAEVEPFKSTFFVLPWTRQAGFFAWWLVLIGASTVWWRPFCRYLCPLGAALALPGSFRLSGPYRRSFCSKCKICSRTCDPRAIRENGTIDPRDCLSCMECEATYNDSQRCPPLIAIDRLTKKSRTSATAGASEADRLADLRREAAKV